MDKIKKKLPLKNRGIKLRWYSLALMTVVTFILFSNSYNSHLPGSIQAKTESFEPALLSDKNIVYDTINIPQFKETWENPSAAQNNSGDMQSWTVRPGDTFSGILQKHGVYSAFSSLMEHNKDDIKPLSKLQVGKPLHMKIANARLEELVYEYSNKEHFLLRRNGDRYITEKRIFPIETREAFAAAVIEDSFYSSAQKAGLSDEIIIETANILAWDIDFILDIRRGDTFSVLYNEKYLYGEKIGNGDIIGIKFTNQGKTFHALRHDTKNGGEYFSLDGKNLRKPFLRSPLKFTRISSTFNPRRLHPIHKIVRPHRGVDYAAPTGTPVSAAGDGKVIFRGRKSGYGNTVIIRHAGIYSTLYAHLSKFSRKIKRNTSVKQGQTIGYVGMTGVATGPHLHYEFLINGRHKNPLTVKLPGSAPLPQKQLHAFRYASAPVIDKLNTLSNVFAESSSD